MPSGWEPWGRGARETGALGIDAGQRWGHSIYMWGRDRGTERAPAQSQAQPFPILITTMEMASVGYTDVHFTDGETET